MARLTRTLVTALLPLLLFAGCAKPLCPVGMDQDLARSKSGHMVFCRAHGDAGRALWIQFYDGGGRRQACPFLAGRPGGLYQAWHKNGSRWLEGRYESGLKTGRWAQWDDGGHPVANGEYREGALVQGAPVAAPAICESVTW